MKKSHLLGAVCACLAVLSTTVNAALVDSILGLDIDGSAYNVTFHQTSDSFRTLWDNDGDWIFGDADGSVFSTAPTFWGDQSGANSAAEAIIAYLGTTHVTTTGSDSFFIPYQTDSNSVTVAYDQLVSTADDVRANAVANPAGPYSAYTFVSFQAVPIPAAVWLFGSGLLGLVGVARRKQSA